MGLHPEVSPVLLGHHIGGDFARTKKGMLRIIDPHLLGNATVVFGFGIVPTVVQFLQKKFVGGVTVNFIGRHKHEHGPGAVKPGHLQEIHRAHCVDVKIVKRMLCRQVMARLGSAVNNQVERTFGLKKAGKIRPAADVQVVVMIVTRHFTQPSDVPRCVPFRTKEFGPHVVIDTDNRPRATVEEGDKLRPDKPTRAGDKYFQMNPLFLYILIIHGSLLNCNILLPFRSQMVRNRYVKLALTALLLFIVAALLRIALATHSGLWADEIFSLAMATGHSLEHPAIDANPALGDYTEPSQAQPPAVFRRYLQHDTPPSGPKRVIHAVLLSDTNPPFYYLLLNAWTRAAGTSDAALRLFSTLWALACLPLLWFLGREVGDRKTAWSVCLLFTFSPPALYYSAEGRMYSLVWLLALALAWASLALARHGPRPYLVLMWIISAAAGLLTHYFFAFVLIACCFWLLIHPGQLSRLRLLAGAVGAGLIVLPWYLLLPESLSRWRVSAGWLDHPLTWKQTTAAPFRLAWSFLSGHGIWGGSKWAVLCAAGLYVLLILVTLRQGMRRLLSERQQLLWLWVLAAILGPLLFDWLRNTNTSLVVRFALPGLPAGLLLAAMAISWLPRKVCAAFVLAILLIWVPGTRDMFARPSRPWEPFPEVGLRLAAWAKPGDLIIVHSIPSGVLGVARYVRTDTPIASWVVQLGQRRVPGDMERLLSGRRRVAVVKIHDLGEPSPAEAWLYEHATLEGQDKLHNLARILYFILK